MGDAEVRGGGAVVGRWMDEPEPPSGVGGVVGADSEAGVACASGGGRGNGVGATTLTLLASVDERREVEAGADAETCSALAMGELLTVDMEKSAPVLDEKLNEA